MATETNLPAGTVIKIKGVPGCEFTLAGTTKRAWDGAERLELTNGGVVRPDRIDQVVSLPSATPAPEVADRAFVKKLTFDYNIAALKLAIALGDEVEFDYEAADGGCSYNRYVLPLSIGDGRLGTLLRATDMDEDAPRTFRVDRIQGKVEAP